MLNKSATGLATALLCLSSVSHAGYNMPIPAPMPGGNWYVGVFGGSSMIGDIDAISAYTGEFKMKQGYDLGLDAGYRVGPFRFEGQYTYLHNSIKDVNSLALGGLKGNGGSIKGHISTQALMANAFYDFNEVSDNFGVYLGAGVGYANLRWAETSNVAQTGFVVGPATAKNNEFAYQAMLGFNFNVDSNFVIDLGYRYLGAAKPKTFSSEHFHDHLVNLGLVYHVPA